MSARRWGLRTRTAAHATGGPEVPGPLTAADLPVRLQRRLERWNRDLRGDPEVVLRYFYAGPDLDLRYFKQTWVTPLDLSPSIDWVADAAYNLAVFTGPDLNVAMLLADFYPRNKTGHRHAWTEWEQLDDYERTSLLRDAIVHTTVTAPTLLGLLDGALDATRDSQALTGRVWAQHLSNLVSAVLGLATGEERDIINLFAGLGTYEIADT